MTKKIYNTAPHMLFPRHGIQKPVRKHAVPNVTSLSLSDNHIQLTQAYERYYYALLKYCYLRVSCKEKALDIVQETFLRTWQYLVQGNIISNDKSFLFTTAQHLIIDEYRKRKTVSLELIIATLDQSQITFEEDLYLKGDSVRAVRMVDTLPLLYRRVLIMRYVEDYSVKEIAGQLHISDTAVSVRIHRGIKILQKIVEYSRPYLTSTNVVLVLSPGSLVAT